MTDRAPMLRLRQRPAQPILENTARGPHAEPANGLGATTRRPARILPPAGVDGVDRLLEHMAGSREHLDEIARHMRQLGAATGPPVLETGTAVLDAQAGWSADRYRVPYKAIAVLNPTAAALTVATMGRQGSAPGAGPGIVVVPPNTFLSVNLEGSALSFYGQAGATVSYSVMAGRVQPFACAINPQAPVAPGAGLQGGGTPVTGPAAGTTIASVVLPAGTFLADWLTSYGAGAVAAADANNMQLLLGATVLLTSLSPAVANTVDQQATVQVVGPGTLAVKTIGAATATANYAAQISATPVNSAY